MKLSIEAEPKEISEFFAEFARMSHLFCQLGEERLAQNIMESLLPKKKEEKDKILSEEVPVNGYFN